MKNFQIFYAIRCYKIPIISIEYFHKIKARFMNSESISCNNFK